MLLTTTTQTFFTGIYPYIDLGPCDAKDQFYHCK